MAKNINVIGLIVMTDGENLRRVQGRSEILNVGVTVLWVISIITFEKKLELEEKKSERKKSE